MLGTLQLTTFAIYYTLGNLSAIACTLFLIGPARQLRLMTKKGRVCSLLVFFGCMALTLIAAFQGFAGMVPCVIFAGLQFCAALYYFLSYIPGGQRGCRMLCERTTGVELPKAP